MSPARLSRFETAIRVVAEFNQARKRHDLVKMLQLLSPTCIYEPADTTIAPDRISGKEAIAQFWQEFFQLYPQASFTVEEVYSAGFHCVLRWCFEVEAEGQKRRLYGVDLFKVTNGLIQEHRSYMKCDLRE